MEAETLSPQIEQRVRDSFASQSFMTTLGAQIAEIAKGILHIRFSRRNDLLQQHGFLHAGVSTAIVDSACGYAALTMAPLESDVLTVEFKTSFLRPAAGEHFLAKGFVIKPGRMLVACEGEVWQGDGDEKLIAKMSATMMIQSRARDDRVQRP